MVVCVQSGCFVLGNDSSRGAQNGLERRQKSTCDDSAVTPRRETTNAANIFLFCASRILFAHSSLLCSTPSSESCAVPCCFGEARGADAGPTGQLLNHSFLTRSPPRILPCHRQQARLVCICGYNEATKRCNVMKQLHSISWPQPQTPKTTTILLPCSNSRNRLDLWLAQNSAWQQDVIASHARTHTSPRKDKVPLAPQTRQWTPNLLRQQQFRGCGH